VGLGVSAVEQMARGKVRATIVIAHQGPCRVEAFCNQVPEAVAVITLCKGRLCNEFAGVCVHPKHGRGRAAHEL
jgi:hypothetical protein